MNSRALRRLAADHGALHSQPLPPNYLFPPSSSSDELTSLDMLLAGPSHTPFAAGVWKLHLTIPPSYPTDPPTAHFRTPIFHPNVDPNSGAVCVETLKRDWQTALTLRDVLITISCLLIQPNPDSALNAEAGALIQEDFATFARRAALLAGIHAVVPESLRAAVKVAQERGQEVQEDVSAGAPIRRRRTMARLGGRHVGRRDEGSPSGGRKLPAPSLPTGPSDSTSFVAPTSEENVFGPVQTAQHPATPPYTVNEDDEEESSMQDAADQENDASRSPTKAAPVSPPLAATPRRPNGLPVPLGELLTADGGDTASSSDDEADDDEEMEQEYPPSPSKRSPRKARQKRKRPLQSSEEGEVVAGASNTQSSPDRKRANITPPTNPFLRPLAQDSPFFSPSNLHDSPRKTSLGKRPPIYQRQQIQIERSVTPTKNSSLEKKGTAADEKAELKRKNAELWERCGRDIRRWNRGDFDGGGGWDVKGERW